MVVWFLFAGKQPDEGFASALRMANMVAHKDYRPALPDGYGVPPHVGRLVVMSGAFVDTA